MQTGNSTAAGCRPVPPVASVLARMQGVLATLERGSGCGDPGVMLAELNEWAPGRARANAVITFEAPRK